MTGDGILHGRDVPVSALVIASKGHDDDRGREMKML